jgi:Flp pilus assembly protein TadG
MLGLVGVTLDFARVFQSWMKLQAVTRDTAEFLAVTGAADPTAEARARICTAMTGSATCPVFGAAAAPSATYGTREVLGATLHAATVTAQWPFETLFLYPVVGGLTGSDAWILTTQVTFEVIRTAD